MPFTWGLDDFPAFEFVTTHNGVIPGLHSPSQMYEIWAGDFDYLHDRLDEAIYILTLYPQCLGRSHRLLMLEGLIDGVGFDGDKRQVQDRWASSLWVAA